MSPPPRSCRRPRPSRTPNARSAASRRRCAYARASGASTTRCRCSSCSTRRSRTASSAPPGITALHFKNALLKIGLSWPSLTKILGRTTDPQRWAILYLGSVKAAAVAPDRDIVVVSRNGNAVDHQEQALRGIEGIILLDGTWSQAKALWWRNAWMLKCKRIVLGPKLPSRYGVLRREPRGDGLSTIEAAAMLLARLERKPEIETALHATFERLLARYRQTHPGSARRRRR